MGLSNSILGSDMLCKSGRPFSHIYKAYNFHNDQVRQPLLYFEKGEDLTTFGQEKKNAYLTMVL